jgi:hypothetical protein
MPISGFATFIYRQYVTAENIREVFDGKWQRTNGQPSGKRPSFGVWHLVPGRVRCGKIGG